MATLIVPTPDDCMRCQLGYNKTDISRRCGAMHGRYTLQHIERGRPEWCPLDIEHKYVRVDKDD